MFEPQPYDLVVLSSYGGPEGQEDVIPFLRNATAGRGIPDERLEEVAVHYRANGGVSPINAQNRALRAALEEALAQRGPALPVHWGNRNWHPLVSDVLREAYAAGHRNILVLPTSAYPGYSSDRQYREDWGMALENLEAAGDIEPGSVRIAKIPPFYAADGLAVAFADGLQASLEQVVSAVAERVGQDRAIERTRILFCTHSIPVTSYADVEAGKERYEGGHAYVEKHVENARKIMALLAERDERLSAIEWELVYQSRSGPPQMPWLEPDVNDRLEELEGQIDGVVMVPLGFISAHMEVQWDLDTEALDTCARLGFIAQRSATPDTHPAFVESLRDLIAQRVAGTAESEEVNLGQRAHVCSPAASPVPAAAWGEDECTTLCCKPLRGASKTMVDNH
ncbi:MAG: ferrochelatase [Rothia sp. (in: high G+C Gram-positive bacteria)]|uniref:ferrochelatase n=1 Tax=Rothia sp. (in: high G+C Gram-positive bacteria) TaxID=1885016 RepID=UPI0026DFC774|nr:ferrochelatase [Rothia sp. (in: high G+C Gram-positive bacteria)]MDO5751066.1 ferrochelatase [Rothia sp. (in: high G+C Gram-positive bacteria)]